MEHLSIDKLGLVDLSNYKLAQDLKKLAYIDGYDTFAFKSCGGHCGDSNCS